MADSEQVASNYGWSRRERGALTAAKMETNMFLVVTAAFGAHNRIALNHPFGPVPTACPLP